MNSVLPLTESPEVTRLALWNQQLQEKGHYTTLPLPGKEQLPPGSTNDWLTWKTLNRLWSDAGRSRSYMARCGYTSVTMCECDQSEQTVQHMLQCQLLDKPCIIQDLADATETAMMCVNTWKKTI